MSGLLIGCAQCQGPLEHCPWCDLWWCSACDPESHRKRAPYCVNRRQGPPEKWLREAAG